MHTPEHPEVPKNVPEGLLKLLSTLRRYHTTPANLQIKYSPDSKTIGIIEPNPEDSQHGDPWALYVFKDNKPVRSTILPSDSGTFFSDFLIRDNGQVITWQFDPQLMTHTIFDEQTGLTTTLDEKANGSLNWNNKKPNSIQLTSHNSNDQVLYDINLNNGTPKSLLFQKSLSRAVTFRPNNSKEIDVALISNLLKLDSILPNHQNLHKRHNLTYKIYGLSFKKFGNSSLQKLGRWINDHFPADLFPSKSQSTNESSVYESFYNSYEEISLLNSFQKIRLNIENSKHPQNYHNGLSLLHLKPEAAARVFTSDESLHWQNTLESGFNNSLKLYFSQAFPDDPSTAQQAINFTIEHRNTQPTNTGLTRLLNYVTNIFKAPIQMIKDKPKAHPTKSHKLSLSQKEYTLHKSTTSGRALLVTQCSATGAEIEIYIHQDSLSNLENINTTPSKEIFPQMNPVLRGLLTTGFTQAEQHKIQNKLLPAQYYLNQEGYTQKQSNNSNPDELLNLEILSPNLIQDFIQSLVNENDDKRFFQRITFSKQGDVESFELNPTFKRQLSATRVYGSPQQSVLADEAYTLIQAKLEIIANKTAEKENSVDMPMTTNH